MRWRTLGTMRSDRMFLGEIVVQRPARQVPFADRDPNGATGQGALECRERLGELLRFVLPTGRVSALTVCPDTTRWAVALLPPSASCARSSAFGHDGH